MRFLRYVWSWSPPNEPSFLIMDNLSANTAPEVIEEAERLCIRFVPILRNSSHLSPIEAHIRSIRRIALSGRDHCDLRALRQATEGAIRELNEGHSEPAHKEKR